MDRLLPIYDYILVGDHQVGVYTGLLFLGFAVTFTILLQVHTDRSKEWARYPAIGFVTAAILAFFMGENFGLFLPEIALLIVGIAMLSAVLLKERVTRQAPS